MFTKPDNRYLMNTNIDVAAGLREHPRIIYVADKFSLDIESISKMFHKGIFNEDEWFAKMEELKSEFLEAYNLLAPESEDDNVHSEN